MFNSNLRSFLLFHHIVFSWPRACFLSFFFLGRFLGRKRIFLFFIFFFSFINSQSDVDESSKGPYYNLVILFRYRTYLRPILQLYLCESEPVGEGEQPWSRGACGRGCRSAWSMHQGRCQVRSIHIIGSETSL